jgi:hypothetical protein
MKIGKWIVLGLGILFLAAMSMAQDRPEVSSISTKPGGLITFGGNPLSLLGTPITEGQRMPSAFGALGGCHGDERGGSFEGAGKGALS